MSKLLYSATMSLDGFIAGAGGDMSWMTPLLGPNPTVDDVIQRIGALLVGNRTFRGDDPHKGMPGEGKAFGGGWSGPQFVVTHHPPADPVPDVTFVDDLDRAVALAREGAGGKYVNVLGADIARQCLERGLLDEMLVMIAPILLGDGVPLYSHPGGATVGLERIHLSDAPNSTNLWYRIVR